MTYRVLQLKTSKGSQYLILGELNKSNSCCRCKYNLGIRCNYSMISNDSSVPELVNSLINSLSYCEYINTLLPSYSRISDKEIVKLIVPFIRDDKLSNYVARYLIKLIRRGL